MSGRVFSLAIAVMIAVAGLQLPPASAGESGDPAIYVEDFTLPTHDGGKVRLRDALKKGPVILDFWATWCTPCRLAMPIYAELAERFADQGLQFLPVSLDTKKAQKKIAPLFAKEGWNFASLLDPKQKVASKLHVMSLPTMFLVDREGRVVAKHVGFRPTMKATLEKEIEALFGSEPSSEPTGR